MYKTISRRIQYEKEHGITNEGRRQQPQPLRKTSDCCKCLNTSSEYEKIASWVRYLSIKPDASTDPIISSGDKLKLQRWGLLDKQGLFDAKKAKLALAKLMPEGLGDPVPYKEKTFRKELPLVTP